MNAKNEISSRFIEAYNVLLSVGLTADKKDFASKIGISPSMVTEISKGRSSVGTSAIQNIVSFFGISANWILTGEGDILPKSDCNASNKEKDALFDNNIIKPIDNMLQGKRIPLVTQTAAAGFGGADFAIAEADVKEFYVVPKFKYCNVDFMIEISGSSMYPKYNSGDVIACSILHESKFIQWNKCHVIATKEQGILCKRLRESEQSDCITAVSDNKEYPPFDIPKNEITGIALVVGVIRLE